MTANVSPWIETPTFVILAVTFVLAAGHRPIAKLWDRLLTHRERMRAIEVDGIVAQTVSAYAEAVKAKLDELVLDVGHRTNSDSTA